MNDLLIGHERSLHDPVVRGDRQRLGELLAAGFREIGSSGKEWTREEVLVRLPQEPPRFFEAWDFTVQPLAEDVSLVRYKTREGEAPAVLRSSIWLKQADGWRMAFHQATKT